MSTSTKLQLNHFGCVCVCVSGCNSENIWLNFSNVRIYASCESWISIERFRTHFSFCSICNNSIYETAFSQQISTIFFISMQLPLFSRHFAQNTHTKHCTAHRIALFITFAITFIVCVYICSGWVMYMNIKTYWIQHAIDAQFIYWTWEQQKTLNCSQWEWKKIVYKRDRERESEWKAHATSRHMME